MLQLIGDQILTLLLQYLTTCGFVVNFRQMNLERESHKIIFSPRATKEDQTWEATDFKVVQ